MKAFMGTCAIGCFAFDEQRKLLTYRLFPKDAAAIAQKLHHKGVLEEEEHVAAELVKMGFTDIVFQKAYTLKGARFLQEDNMATEILQQDLRQLALKLEWGTPAELNALLTQVYAQAATQAVSQERRDIIAMRTSGFLDELGHAQNVFAEMLKEWYGLHMPAATAGDQTALLAIISEGKEGSGMPFTVDDKKAVKQAASVLKEMEAVQTTLSRYLERQLVDYAPNCSAIAGPVLAARFLVHAGGLDKLARLPSTTIQILGAEKALFRHLKEHTKAPKYGILFGHPAIQQAPPELRGKVARLIAAKLALAARMDFFTKNDQSKALRKALEKDIAAITGKKTLW